MTLLKVALAAIPAAALCLLLWPAGRAHLKGLLRATLWASCLMTTGTAAVILSNAKEQGLVAIVGGLLLLGFSAYAAVTAKSLGSK